MATRITFFSHRANLLCCGRVGTGRWGFIALLSTRFGEGNLSVLFAVIFFELGCTGPSIQQFSVDPQVLCEGESAVIRWNATGEPAMAYSLESAPGGENSCGARGRETFAITLVARKGSEEAQRKVEVVQLHEGAAEPIALRTIRLEGATVVAVGEENPAMWSDRVQIATVASCQSRVVEVQHAGKTAVLPANGAASDALNGTALAGSWAFRSPLSSDEQKNPALRPKDLEVLATLRCRKGTP
jgi:hypothetical protein